MKFLSTLLAILLIFTGCSAAVLDSGETTIQHNPENTASTETTIAASETTIETQPETTEAPDPMEQLLQDMTTEEKVGQLFLARCPETNAESDISTYHLGGYILFGRDFENQTPDTLRQTLEAYQDAASIPLLIAVDEEGGTVCRVSSNRAFRSSRFPSPRDAYAAGGLKRIQEFENEKCDLLHSLGINVNMAPVCDITTDSQAFMYKRSLGQSPEITGQFVQDTIAIMASHQVGSVLKHFPGYGNNTDTHTGIAVDERSLFELESADLVPFSAGIESGCDAILVSHTMVQCLDTEYPASLSPAVHRYLREEMGFDGVIVTDDLVMDAITEQYGVGEAAVLAVLAGNDLLCSTEYATQYNAVLAAVNDGRIPVETLDAAVLRILHWKESLNLFSESQ